MVTKNQVRVLEVLRGANIGSAAIQLGISRQAIYDRNSRTYREFIHLLDLVLDNYPVFERRFEKDREVYPKLRRLARQIRPNDKNTK